MIKSDLFSEPRKITKEEFLQLEKGDVVFVGGDIASVVSTREIPFSEFKGATFNSQFKSMHHCVFEVTIKTFDNFKYYFQYPCSKYILDIIEI